MGDVILGEKDKTQEVKVIESAILALNEKQSNDLFVRSELIDAQLRSMEDHLRKLKRIGKKINELSNK